MKTNSSNKITLQEINNFRILSSSPPPHTRLVPVIDVSDINLSECSINHDLIKDIFLTLKMKHGGKIWLKTKIVIKENTLGIFLGPHKILSSDKFDPDKKIKPGNYSIPIAFDVFFYKNFPKTEEISLHNISSNYLENYSYNCLRDINFRIHSDYHQEITLKHTPITAQEKYFDTLKRLNLPISFDLFQDNYIINHLISKEPLLEHEAEYKRLCHFASFIFRNSLSTEKFSDTFQIYRNDSNEILTRGDSIAEYYKILKKNYREKVDNKSHVDRFVEILEGRRRLGWEKIGQRIQDFLKFSTPFIALYAAGAPALYILSISDFNTNFAASIFIPGVTSPILYNFSFYLTLTFFLLIGFKISPYVMKLVDLTVKNILRRKRIIDRKQLGKFISSGVPLCVGLLVWVPISAKTISNPLEIIVYPSIIPSAFILILKAFTQFSIEYSFYILIWPIKIVNFFYPIIILIITGFLVSDNKSLHGQNCSYIYYADTQKSYYYRYFETNNWENSLEIAILPGSSSYWIDETKIDVPAKITVRKDDLRKLNSCTDKASSWTAVESTFIVGSIAAEYGYIKSTYQKIKPPYSSIDKMPPYATPFTLKHKAMNNI